MNEFARCIVTIALVVTSVATMAADGITAHPEVRIETTEGLIVLELNTRRAPLTVKHFVELARSGFYEGTTFHRVIRKFMIQGGGYDAKYADREDDRKIPNESGNGLSNVRGSIAMARTADPHSANSQFFINLADNKQLDPSPDRWGYAVFGEVINGMDVVDSIAQLPTGPGGRFPRDVPAIPIIIKKVTVVTD